MPLDFLQIRDDLALPLWQAECTFTVMARDHRKLEAFHIADELAVAMYMATAAFPASERLQFMDSAAAANVDKLGGRVAAALAALRASFR